MTPLFNTGDSKTTEEAKTRQEVVDSLWHAMTDAVEGLVRVPFRVKEAFARVCWKQERILATGGTVPPMSFHDFVHEHYPRGLGSDYEKVHKILAQQAKETGDNSALEVWDRETQQSHGGAHNPEGHNQHAQPEKVVNVYQVHVDQEPAAEPPAPAPKRPSGNSRQRRLRRLRKAAEAGDATAKELKQKVNASGLSLSAAWRAMGWSKPRTPLQDLQSAWRRASADERAEFCRWIDADQGTTDRCTGKRRGRRGCVAVRRGCS